MKELEKMAVKGLIETYQLFIFKGIIKEVTDKARSVYNEFIPGGNLLRETIMGMIGSLFAIAYPDVNSGLNPPTKKEAKEILEKLKKLQKELEWNIASA